MLKRMRCGPIISSPTSPIVQEQREARRLESKRRGDRKYNKTRDPKYVRFYNGMEWRTLSAKYTQDKGYRCEVCGAMATQVHHKKAIQTPEGWELRLDYNNLELLCTACHNDRHERFKRRKKYIKK